MNREQMRAAFCRLFGERPDNRQGPEDGTEMLKSFASTFGAAQMGKRVQSTLYSVLRKHYQNKIVAPRSPHPKLPTSHQVVAPFGGLQLPAHIIHVEKWGNIRAEAGISGLCSRKRVERWEGWQIPELLIKKLFIALLIKEK